MVVWGLAACKNFLRLIENCCFTHFVSFRDFLFTLWAGRKFCQAWKQIFVALRSNSIVLIDNAKVIKFRELTKNTGVWIYTFEHLNLHFNSSHRSQITVSENRKTSKERCIYILIIYILYIIYIIKILVNVENHTFDNCDLWSVTCDILISINLSDISYQKSNFSPIFSLSYILLYI